MSAVSASSAEGAAARTLGLRAAARLFLGFGSPRVMGVVSVAAVAARIALGRWTWSDAVIVAAILVVEPFVEWVLHVFLLHFKPRLMFGRTVDPIFAKRHRMHHRNPRNARLVFVPLPVLAGFVVILSVISWFGFGAVQTKMTALATMTSFLFGYEWSHYLIHSSYVPRSRLFKAVWRAHILHHYKNEKYWFGVTNPIADHVLRTYPRKDSVETSPTARTLGVDDEFTLIGASASA